MADQQSPTALAWQRLLDGIAAGELIKDLMAREGITRSAVRHYIASNPAARAQWDAAREASADAFMDRALDEAMANYEQSAAAHVRTRIDTLKWAARIRNPRLYSDKAQLDVNVRTVDLTRIIEAANARLAGRAPLTLEHEARAALPDPSKLLALL